MPTANGNATWVRNAGIDQLRGLSILLVVLHHIALRIPLKDGVLAGVIPRSILNALSYNGYEAVFVFFVISGFLIASHSMTRWGSLARIRPAAFYARRFARIAPCLVLLVVVLAALHLAGVRYYVIDRAGQSLAAAIRAVFGFYLNGYEGSTGYLPGGWDVLWSLSIEEVFYLGFPLVCLVVRSEKVLAVLLAVFACTLPATRAALAGNEIWQEKAYLPGMAAIAAGILAALVAVRFHPPRAWLVNLLAIVGAFALMSVLFVENFLWPVLGNGVMLILTGGVACLVVALHWREAAGRSTAIAGMGWLRSLGRLSYEIYLTHMFVVFGIFALVKASAVDIRYGFIWYVPVVGLAWMLGAAVAHVYSIPCDRALRRLLSTDLRVAERWRTFRARNRIADEV